MNSRKSVNTQKVMSALRHPLFNLGIADYVLQLPLSEHPEDAKVNGYSLSGQVLYERGRQIAAFCEGLRRPIPESLKERNKLLIQCQGK